MHSDAASIPPVHPLDKDVFDSWDSGQFVVLSLIKNTGYRLDIVREPFWIWLCFCNYLIYLLFFLIGYSGYSYFY